MRNRLLGTATLHAPPCAGHGDRTLPLPLSDADEGPRRPPHTRCKGRTWTQVCLAPNTTTFNIRPTTAIR